MTRDELIELLAEEVFDTHNNLGLRKTVAEYQLTALDKAGLAVVSIDVVANQILNPPKADDAEFIMWLRQELTAGRIDKEPEGE